MRSVNFALGSFFLFTLAIGLVDGQNTVPRDSRDKKNPDAEKPLPEVKKAGAVLDVNGMLMATDPADAKSNEPHKLHKVKVAAGKTYVIQMTSGTFDTFLRLEDANAKELAEDDDGAGETNAQIVYHSTKNEELRIIATRFEDGGMGNYHLTVRELTYP